jgi:hypothetical protein
MRQRLSAKKLVVATYLQYIPADGADYHTGSERRALPQCGGYLRQIPQTRLRLCAIKSASGWAVAYFTFGSYALPMGRWVVIGEIAPVLGAVPAVLIAPFSGGLEGDTLVALFLLLA